MGFGSLLCRIIDVDLTLKEDKILFQGAQKLWLGLCGASASLVFRKPSGLAC